LTLPPAPDMKGANVTAKKIIQPKGIAEAVGPFSRAILIGDHLYIAGTTALSHVSGDYYNRPIPAGIEEQTRLTLENIKKCVEAVGGTMDDIFKVVIMLKDPADYKKMNAVRAEYFKKEPPISTCFRAEVMRDDLLVEIEAVALVQSRT
jgi:enamine deaminase RidA (YjgF/YER057c/UK114 family)